MQNVHNSSCETARLTGAVVVVVTLAVVEWQHFGGVGRSDRGHI